MCNSYSLTKGQAAIIALVRAMRDRTGNLPPMPGIFPDFLAPIARNAPDGVRELVMALWGMPGPPAYGGATISTRCCSRPLISGIVQVFGRRDDETIHALGWPASKKRQGTKSREVCDGGAAGAMGILPRIGAC